MNGRSQSTVAIERLPTWPAHHTERADRDRDRTTDLRITTAVTCPTVRIHPAIIAHATATAAVLTGGRFRLGVGTGEKLNEHVLGDVWPPVEIRLEMLEDDQTGFFPFWRDELRPRLS